MGGEGEGGEGREWKEVNTPKGEKEGGREGKREREREQEMIKE